MAQKCRFLLFAKYNYNGEVKKDEMGRACSTNGRGLHTGYGGTARRKEIKMRMNGQYEDGSWRHKVRWCGVDWTGSQQGPLEGSCELACWEHAGKFLSSCIIDSLLRRAQLHGVS